MILNNQIENLEEFLKPYLGESNKITTSKISFLVPPGENKLSEVLKLEVTLNNEEKAEEEELSIVVKTVPTSSTEQPLGKLMYEFMFKNEIAFYNLIVPLLQQFQKEQGIENVIDFFPKLYASRQNLRNDDEEEFDEHALLLFEDLTTTGYKNVDRLVLFDLDTTKLILEDLASFAAIPIAMRLLDEELFTEKLKPKLVRFFPKPPGDDTKDMQHPFQGLGEILSEFDEFLPFVDIIMENIQRKFNGLKELPADNIFTTISHGDLWVNNIMIKFHDGKPVKNKFVDFQTYSYKSAASDLFFFLWSSVHESVLEENIDELVRFYYEKLIENFEKLSCNTNIFTFDEFLEEIKNISKIDFGQVMFMTFGMIFGQKGKTERNNGLGIQPLKKEDITQQARERALFVIRECSKRGWMT